MQSTYRAVAIIADGWQETGYASTSTQRIGANGKLRPRYCAPDIQQRSCPQRALTCINVAGPYSSDFARGRIIALIGYIQSLQTK
jgi:hypothetical protein